MVKKSRSKDTVAVLKVLEEVKKPTLWQRVRIFFKDSEVIFLARLQLIIGFAVAALAGMDWSPLVSLGAGTGFTQSQLISLGSILLVQGVVTEIARRAREPEMQKNAPP